MQNNSVDSDALTRYLFCMIALDANSMTHLADIADIAAGHSIRSAVDELPAGGIAVVQMRNVDPDLGVDWSGLRAVELPPARKMELLRPGDVIFSTRGTRN